MTAGGGLAQLSPEQRSLLDDWLPGVVLVRDHSWGLVETTVLEVRHDGGHYIVKAAGPSDHHLARELRAHAEWLTPWTSIGRAARLVRGDAAARMLVTEYLPGELVLGTPYADEPDTYRQAGTLLALLHGQLAVPDVDHEARENARVLAWLDTDLTRLAAQDFARDPRLERAFFEGYLEGGGADPREPAAWHRTRVREAIGTAVWAHQVGDEAFEAQGHRMIAEALADDD